jgi:hypothetical protein
VHAVHAWFTVALPLVETYSPGWQVVHDEQGVVDVASWSHVPLPHETFALVLPAQ